MKQKYKILITGANGLLGKRLVKQLSLSNEIYALVRHLPDNAIDKVNYLVINLSDSWDIVELPEQLDVIIHLAQSSKFREFPDQAMDIFNVNINSTAKLLDYAHKSGVKSFIYASSGGVYGTGSEAFNENSPIISNGELGYYLGSKLCGEVLVQNYATLMNIITLRFFFMYGEEQEKSMLIPRLVDSVKNGKPISLQGQEGIKINPIYVQDAVNAIEKSLDVEKSFAYNIAGNEVLSLKQIMTVIGDVLGKNPVFKYQEVEPKDLIADNSEMKTHLVSPDISFREGIGRFV